MQGPLMGAAPARVAATRTTWLERVGPWLVYVYLLRVPILLWLALVALPFLAVPDGAPAEGLLRGVFDIALPGPPGWTILSFFLVTLTSLMAATAIGVTARLILLDGAERFGAGRIPDRPGLRLAMRLVPLAAAIPVVVGAAYQTGWRVGAISITAGIVSALLVFFALMRWAHDFLWDLVVVGDCRWIPARVKPELRQFLNNELGRLATAASRLMQIAELLVRLSPVGYCDPATGRMRPRHQFAVLQAFLSLVLYGALGTLKWQQFGREPAVPTLCVVLVLLMLACLTLTAVSFFVDRFRIPVLAVVVLYITGVSAFPQGDNFYLSVPAAARPRLTPAAVLAARQDKPVILIATEGGGIQAAAWTTHVVAGIKQSLPDNLQEEFDRSVRLVSSVSGGSVGGMYLIDAYQQGRLPPVPADIASYEAVAASRASSLDAVAWGLAYPDLIWSVLPFLKGVYAEPLSLVNGPNLTSDRGSALEDAWKRTRTLERATLDAWREDLKNHQRPAVIFNATIVETGERMLLSTTDMGDGCTGPNSHVAGRREIACEYPDVDVQVATAARLSATFPYVTPAARILRNGIFAREYHVVDGGYYDNYGVATLVEWLDEGLRAAGPRPSRVLILQIRAMATQAYARPDGSRGWGFQVLHPISTLMAVRGAGQRSHNEVELGLLRRTRYGVPVTTAEFEFAGRGPDGELLTAPLSWRLTPDQKEAISDFWKNDPGIRHQRDAVATFLRTP